jgi:hypothetical protein
MSSDTARTPPRRPYHLLLWFVGLLAIALAGIAVLGIFDAAWSLGLALLLAAVTAVGALREIRAVLANGDGTAVRARSLSVLSPRSRFCWRSWWRETTRRAPTRRDPTPRAQRRRCATS